jgi:hypothetical protein
VNEMENVTKNWYEALLEFKKLKEKQTQSIDELKDIETRINSIIEIVHKNNLLSDGMKKDLIEKLKDIRNTIEEYLKVYDRIFLRWITNKW